jgi:cobalt transporter subunit CbtB
MSYAISALRTPTASFAAAAPALLAIVLGAFLVLGVGFAAPAAIHNAAHDVRHAYAFPCH